MCWGGKIHSVIRSITQNSPPWKGGVPDRREGEVVEFVCSFYCVSYN